MNDTSPKSSLNQLLHHPIFQGLAMLFVLVLITWLAIAPHFPRGFTPSSAPGAEYSAERAMVYLPTISKQPHPAGSPAQAEVRAYLLQQLTDLGLETNLQPFGRYVNVVARLPGKQSTGAIVILAHYDSVSAGPGAADNGSAVVALLEIMRALVEGPQLHNDVIALFDDAEEIPPGFVGTRAFVHDHPWMADVKVAIGLDTAIRGPIMVDDTSTPNGKMAHVLADVYRSHYVWNSISGGGRYDSLPFRLAGIQALELEDNYPFWWQHTSLDQIDRISPASLQQLGEQTLAIASRLGELDLNQSWGVQEAFFSVPLFGFLHYPLSWTLPLTIVAVVLLLAVFVLTLRRRITSWRGLAVGAAAILLTVLMALLIVGQIWSRLPNLLSWKIWSWPMWPEVIPPNGGWIFMSFISLASGLAVLAYWLSRKISSRADLALVGIVPFALLALAYTITDPRTAIVALWPTLIASVGWLLFLAFAKKDGTDGDWPAWITALGVMAFMPFVILATFRGSGLDSIASISEVWVLLILAVLPALEAILIRLAVPK